MEDLPGAEAPADIELAESIVRDRWFGMSLEDAEFIVHTTQQLSGDELRRHPLLLHAAVVSLNLLHHGVNGGDRSELFEHLSEVIDLTVVPPLSVEDAVIWRMLQMMARRWRGEISLALQISDRLEQMSASQSPATPFAADNGARAHPGEVAYQRGITALLGGRSREAMELFGRSYRSGGRAPYRHFAARGAAANAAMLAAFEGHDTMAEKWRLRAEAGEAVPNWCSDLLTLGTRIASCIHETDVLRLDAAGEHAEYLKQIDDRFELWPFQLAAITTYELAIGQPVQAYSRLKAVGFERGLVISEVTIADHLVFRTYLDTLLAGGEGGLVIRLAEDMGNPLRSLVPVARTRLLAGDELGASRVAGQAMRRVLLPKRDMWEASVVHAIAKMRQGKHDAARRSINIVLAGNPRMLPSILSRYSAEDVGEMYRLVGAEPPLSRPAPLFTGAASIVVLTANEQQVLQHLADGLAPAEIAAREFKSEHTVRTQIKSLYRKLEVQTKHDAISRANHLGLLRWHHRDGLKMGL